MDKKLGLKFAKVLNGLEGKEYIEAVVAFAAAPTIHGEKPSSLMTFRTRGKNTLSLWNEYGKEICDYFHLEQYELKNGENGRLILLYRKEMLERFMGSGHNLPFLKNMGYGDADSLEEKLEILKQRFEVLCPHEVGVFLGIPVEDVEGFIRNEGKNCLLCRYWKVYANTQRAEVLFSSFDRARKRMVEFILSTRPDRMAQCI